MKVGIIGGSGLTQLTGMKSIHAKQVETPYGTTSAPLVGGQFAGCEVIFLPRHGKSHTLAPHKINYRANIHALKVSGVEAVIGVAAVGSINHTMTVSSLVLPDQILDYTYDRQHTFFDGVDPEVTHIDFTHPYCELLRKTSLSAADDGGIKLHPSAVYAVTQGPRLETAAEINRLERDGADIVGMTAMPEAALARECEMRYMTLAVVANQAAGRGHGDISIETIYRNLESGMQDARALLSVLLPKLVI